MSANEAKSVKGETARGAAYRSARKGGVGLGRRAMPVISLPRSSCKTRERGTPRRRTGIETVTGWGQGDPATSACTWSH